MIKNYAHLDYVKGELQKLAPVKIEADLTNLTENEKQVVYKLVEAGKIIDQLFLLQVDEKNPDIRNGILKSKNIHNATYLEMYDIMFGSWNRLDHDRPFINNIKRPITAGFYPTDLTKKEFETFLVKHQEQRSLFEYPFTVIRRTKEGLKAVKYHIEYADLINELNKILKEAATLAENKNLKKFLNLRADNLLTDNYYESDMAWMDLNGKIEIVIGPYEVYEDQLFSYKAAYEEFLCIVDHDASDKLATVSHYLDEMEDNLPIANKHKNFSRGAYSPIKVVQEIYTAGDTKAGVQTAAFNLPNDERVREAKGCKKVMLKNITEAKFNKILIPIADRILAEKALHHVSFDCYFNHILMHEISHGLGPGTIKLPDGKVSTVSKELKELYLIIEECKADVLGLYNYLFLIEKGVFKEAPYSTYASYLGGMFRSIRFGINEAHGGGVAIQFNYLLKNGAFYIDDKEKLDIDPDKIEQVLTDLAHELLIIEAEGDYNAAQKLISEYSVMTSFMEKTIEKMANLPIDIRPQYTILNQTQ